MPELVLKKIAAAVERGELPQAIASNLQLFYRNYSIAYTNSPVSRESTTEEIFDRLLALIIKDVRQPFRFDHYHQRVTEPDDYLAFGLDFFRPLLDRSRSQVLGDENLQCMQDQIAVGENVFLLANHQTEADPQLLYLLLEKDYPELADKMIFVAGHRVTHDPIAKPFSMGCNLLTIYSKKHIERPPEQRGEKLAYNQRTMKTMHQLLSQGGQCIYIAPSGGRDRPTQNGRYSPAPFDPPSLEMTLVQGKRVLPTTHYYPLALWTYPLLPPPDLVGSDLGEMRTSRYSPAFAAFGGEIDVDDYEGKDLLDKKARRQARTQKIWELMYRDYQLLEKLAEQ